MSKISIPNVAALAIMLADKQSENGKPTTTTNGEQEKSPMDALEFLKSYPQFNGLSLDMSETRFKAPRRLSSHSSNPRTLSPLLIASRAANSCSIPPGRLLINFAWPTLSNPLRT